jgi:hypothetical protein
VIPELAMVKLMWALGWAEDYAQAKEILAAEVVNEFGRK